MLDICRMLGGLHGTGKGPMELRDLAGVDRTRPVQSGHRHGQVLRSARVEQSELGPHADKDVDPGSVTSQRGRRPKGCLASLE